MSKSFSTYKPSEIKQFDINGTVFRINPSIPGDMLLDFMSQMNEENPAAMAGTVRKLLDAAIYKDDLESFKTFIRDPENNVGLELLAEIAGYVAEASQGNRQQPLSSMSG